MTRTLILTAFVCICTTAFRASDGVTGTWKRTSMLLVESDGKTTDMMAMLTSSMPCTKDITYTFLGDGQLKTTVPDACGKLRKTVEDMNVDSRWAVSGRKVTITTTMKGFPPATYDVNFQSTTMTWLFNFADNPTTPNPTKAKRMTIVYQRIY